MVPFPLVVYPLPVEITNHTDWWQPWLPFAGSALLFIGAMCTVWRTNKAAAARMKSQLFASREEAAADRAAQRADKLREDVASILAERWPTIDAATELANAVFEYLRDGADPAVRGSEREAKYFGIHEKQREQFNKLVQLVIRASLLTNDEEISVTLGDIRKLAAEGWNEIGNKRCGGGDPYVEMTTFRDKLHAKFNDLERETRRIVTTDQLNPIAGQKD